MKIEKEGYWRLLWALVKILFLHLFLAPGLFILSWLARWILPKKFANRIWIRVIDLLESIEAGEE